MNDSIAGLGALMWVLILFGIVQAVFCAYFCFILARDKNYDKNLAIFSGIIFGIWAILIYGFLPEKKINNKVSQVKSETGQLTESEINRIKDEIQARFEWYQKIMQSEIESKVKDEIDKQLKSRGFN